MITADICMRRCQQGLCWGSKRLAPVWQPQTYATERKRERKRDRDTPWGNAVLLSDTLLRFTAHWSSPNSSKVSVGQIRRKHSHAPYCLLSQQSWPWCKETKGGPHSLRKWPTGNRTSVTQFLASFSAFLNSIYMWHFCGGNVGLMKNWVMCFYYLF